MGNAYEIGMVGCEGQCFTVEIAALGPVCAAATAIRSADETVAVSYVAPLPWETGREACEAG